MFRFATYLFCQMFCLEVNASEPIPAEWAIADFADQSRQRVALLVTAQVNGRPCRMQLDTGANRAVIWHDYKNKTSKPVQLSVEFAGITRLAPAQPEFAKDASKCQELGVIGTLGNAFFDQGSLSVDLATPTIAYTPDSLLSGKAHAQPMFYPRWEGGGGHPLVELRNDEGLLGYALLDTGSAAFGLGVQSDADWNRMTSGAPLSAGAQVRSFKVHAWGHEHTCYLYAAGARMQAGAMPSAQVPVQYCPTLEFKLSIRLAGVLGMSPFGNSTIILDYKAGRWAVEDN